MTRSAVDDWQIETAVRGADKRVCSIARGCFNGVSPVQLWSLLTLPGDQQRMFHGRALMLPRAAQLLHTPCVAAAFAVWQQPLSSSQRAC